MNNIDFNFLLLNHIPVKGFGYSPFHNIDNDSLITTIQKQLEFNLEQISDKDNSSHSMLNIQLLDKSRLVFYNTVFSLAHSDETGRQGIFFGIYLIFKMKEFKFSMLEEISSLSDFYLEEIMEGHKELKRNAKIIVNKENLIEEYTNISLKFLNGLNELFKYSFGHKTSSVPSFNIFESLFDNEDFKILLEKKIIEILGNNTSSKRKLSIITRGIKNCRFNWLFKGCSPL